MASFAFLSGAIFIMQMARQQKLYYDKLFDHLILLFFTAIIIARLSYFVIYNYQFEHWYQIFYLWNGGMTSYGGILGALLFALYIFRKNRLVWLDMTSVGFLLGTFFWRIGCFLSGDHTQVFSNSIIAINHQFPAILLESILGLVGFILFFNIYQRINKKIGITFFLILGYYGIIRIIVDQFRIDPMLWGLRSGQVLGICLVMGAIIGIIILERGLYAKKDRQSN